VAVVGEERDVGGAVLAVQAGGAEVAAAVGNQLSMDARNPSLTGRQRSVRVVGAGVEAGGGLAAVAAGAAGGAAIAGPVGAFGAGVAVTVAGESLDVDGAIQSGVDKAFDAADAVGDVVGGIL
jgi:hypothetical protein